MRAKGKWTPVTNETNSVGDTLTFVRGGRGRVRLSSYDIFLARVYLTRHEKSPKTRRYVHGLLDMVTVEHMKRSGL